MRLVLLRVIGLSNHGVGSTDHAKTGIGQYVNIARFFVTHISFKNDAANIQKNNGNT